MENLGRWPQTITVCPVCGDLYGAECGGTLREPHDMVTMGEVEVVPIADLRGAEEALKRIVAIAGDDVNYPDEDAALDLAANEARSALDCLGGR
jgi:hypothetical protein